MTGNIYQGIQDMIIEWLYSTVAVKLSRRPVTVLWAPIEDANGQVFKNYGKFYLQMDPSLDHDQRFAVFLHECAHLRLHHKNITDQSKVKAAIPLQDLNPAIIPVIKGIANTREAEAWQLANAWLELAGDGSITQRLKRLRDMIT